ncbi:uncharacterized protein BXZ73DRAFT_53623 [Epithele typhae]|uniref:uncharacterized protein n=1 Tax=Epithele typhae TaxID=378194 RepID=UPI002008CE76|nr:uncharacterized protein BXZ73DRAFT_53623 [Epithele typhae]KAH9916725.1 hypothetical protein BXZ73DRAFT_53623 [Epithele typhae]
MATATAAIPSSQPGFAQVLGGDKYRGAVVEDLQLPPAFALPADEAISRAIEMAYERDFSHIPVLDRNRKPLGYIDVTALKTKWEAGGAHPDDKVDQYMSRFKRTAATPYTVITPSTPLADLETFLKANIFAIVTDRDRKFVLGVVTSHDLENFVSRRGL